MLPRNEYNSHDHHHRHDIDDDDDDEDGAPRLSQHLERSVSETFRRNRTSTGSRARSSSPEGVASVKSDNRIWKRLAKRSGSQSPISMLAGSSDEEDSKDKDDDDEEEYDDEYDDEQDYDYFTHDIDNELKKNKKKENDELDFLDDGTEMSLTEFMPAKTNYKLQKRKRGMVRPDQMHRYTQSSPLRQPIAHRPVPTRHRPPLPIPYNSNHRRGRRPATQSEEEQPQQEQEPINLQDLYGTTTNGKEQENTNDGFESDDEDTEAHDEFAEGYLDEETELYLNAEGANYLDGQLRHDYIDDGNEVEPRSYDAHNFGDDETHGDYDHQTHVNHDHHGRDDYGDEDETRNDYGAEEETHDYDDDEEEETHDDYRARDYPVYNDDVTSEGSTSDSELLHNDPVSQQQEQQQQQPPKPKPRLGPLEPKQPTGRQRPILPLPASPKDRKCRLGNSAAKGLALDQQQRISAFHSAFDADFKADFSRMMMKRKKQQEEGFVDPFHYSSPSGFAEFDASRGKSLSNHNNQSRGKSRPEMASAALLSTTGTSFKVVKRQQEETRGDSSNSNSNNITGWSAFEPQHDGDDGDIKKGDEETVSLPDFGYHRDNDATLFRGETQHNSLGSESNDWAAFGGKDRVRGTSGDYPSVGEDSLFAPITKENDDVTTEAGAEENYSLAEGSLCLADVMDTTERKTNKTKPSSKKNYAFQPLHDSFQEEGLDDAGKSTMRTRRTVEDGVDDDEEEFGRSTDTFACSLADVPDDKKSVSLHTFLRGGSDDDHFTVGDNPTVTEFSVLTDTFTEITNDININNSNSNNLDAFLIQRPPRTTWKKLRSAKDLKTKLSRYKRTGTAKVIPTTSALLQHKFENMDSNVVRPDNLAWRRVPETRKPQNKRNSAFSAFSELSWGKEAEKSTTGNSEGTPSLGGFVEGNRKKKEKGRGAPIDDSASLPSRPTLLSKIQEGGDDNNKSSRSVPNGFTLHQDQRRSLTAEEEESDPKILQETSDFAGFDNDTVMSVEQLMFTLEEANCGDRPTNSNLFHPKKKPSLLSLEEMTDILVHVNRADDKAVKWEIISTMVDGKIAPVDELQFDPCDMSSVSGVSHL